MAVISGYAVIQDTHVGLNGSSAEIFEARMDAIAYVDRENRAAEEARVPVHFRVFELRELAETEMWDWGLRTREGRVTAFVHERAARNSRYGDERLVHRRAGTEDWEEAT